MYNLEQIREELRTNLDDETKTGWSDIKLTILINNALRWIVNIADSHDSFYRINSNTIAIVSGTNSYTLPTEDFLDIRKILLIERDESNRRVAGKLVNYRQRNQNHTGRYDKIGTFYMVHTVDNNGKHTLSFAHKNDPTDSWTLLVSFAPAIKFLINNGDLVIDVNEEHVNTLILRATIMGYGGEKNVDSYWLAQYQDALQNSMESFETPNRDGIEIMTLVDE